MKRMLTFLLLTVCLESGYASGPCHQPNKGPPGIQGPAGISQSTAFGSFYSIESDHYDLNDNIAFPITTSIRNVSHPSDTEFVILQSGYYYFNFGVSSHQESEFSEETVAALYVDDVFEVPGSRLYFFPHDVITSTGVVVPLQEGQTVTLRNVVNPFDSGEGTFDPPPVTVYLNMIRLAPL